MKKYGTPHFATMPVQISGPGADPALAHTPSAPYDTIDGLVREKNRLEVERDYWRALASEILDLVEESRRLFHDSTLWEDEDYVEPHDIAKHWKAVQQSVWSQTMPTGGGAP